MKRILIAGFAILSVSVAEAQQKEGKVTYQRSSQMQARFNINGVENVVPQNRSDNFELVFGNNHSLWKAAEQENDDDGSLTSEVGAQVRMIVSGSNDVSYCNFKTGKRTEKREFLGKTFIIDDSIGTRKWKMTGETKTILNFPCMKATTTNISTRTIMNMENGKIDRKEVQDTSTIVAWFTTAVPVSTGPGEYQGQLPGLILEMDINNGTQVYTATAFSEKADLAVIKEPTGKKHYTPAEFSKERDKMIKEMQENNGQGGRNQSVIRMN